MLSRCMKHLWINFTSLVKQRWSICHVPCSNGLIYLHKPSADVLCCNYGDNETHQLGQWIHERYNISTPALQPTNALNWCFSPLIQSGLGSGRDGPQSGSPNKWGQGVYCTTASIWQLHVPVSASNIQVWRNNRVGTQRDMLPGSGLKCVRTFLLLDFNMEAYNFYFILFFWWQYGNQST